MKKILVALPDGVINILDNEVVPKIGKVIQTLSELSYNQLVIGACLPVKKGGITCQKTGLKKNFQKKLTY